MKFIKEKMTLVLNSNDDFLEEVYNNKDKKVRVEIYEIISESRLSKKPIAFVELDYEDWNKLDNFSYLSDACFEDINMYNEYNNFMENLINKINSEDLIQLI